MQDKYFKDKKVLITGITGFVGFHLAKKLETLGAKVYGISRTTGKENIIKANISNFSVIDKFMRNLRINICCHLAGESLVESGQKDPYNTLKINIEGALSILESARKNKLEKIIIASTTHVYGDNKLPYIESYTPKPSRPYETSKACTDLIAQSYADTYNLPVLIPRFVNIYGPGDLNFSRLIPKIVKSILDKKALEMWGGDALRDYLYIDDAINAYIKLIRAQFKSTKENRVLNFGSGNRASVEEIIKKIIKISGKDLKVKKIEDQRPLEIGSQYVSFTKAKRILDWNPSVGLDDGLALTYAWYKDYLKSEMTLVL